MDSSSPLYSSSNQNKNVSIHRKLTTVATTSDKEQNQTKHASSKDSPFECRVRVLHENLNRQESELTQVSRTVNKQGYQISLALNCFYSFQKGSINLALTKRGTCCLVLTLVRGLNQTSLCCHFSQESSVANRGEYRSCLSRGFNFRLGRFATSRVESSTQILFLLVGTIL
jgi:hypothetical protein